MMEMTHGKRAKSDFNARTENDGGILTGNSPGPERSLADTLASLEARIASLEERVDRLDGVAPAHFYGSTEETEKTKPGPSKRIADAELLRNRDALVSWLEENWSSMVKGLLAAKTPREVATVLRQVARRPDLRPPWENRFLGHAAQLLDFLQSKKFRRKPPKKTVVDALNRPIEDERRKRAGNRLPTRQIANAMAGVPKLRWPTSLDRCSRNPSSLQVARDAATHYRAIFAIAIVKPGPTRVNVRPHDG
jgi:hypothetical protein